MCKLAVFLSGTPLRNRVDRPEAVAVLTVLAVGAKLLKRGARALIPVHPPHPTD